MSNLIQKIDDAILNIRKQENNSVLQEYNQWIEATERNATSGVIAYSSWLLKDMKDLSEFYLKDTHLLMSFRNKVKDNRLVGVTSEEMKEAWPMLANYVGCMHMAKRLAKVYSFLKWDDAWEQEIIKKGKEGILSTMVNDLTHYETYAEIMSEKGYSQPINRCRTDLIIKSDIIKNYLGEASDSVVRMMSHSIKKLRKLEVTAQEVRAKKDYNNWMTMSESAAENGGYELPISLMLEVDMGNLNIPKLGKLSQLWGEIAKYQHYLDNAGKIVKENPSLALGGDYVVRKRKIEPKGRLNVICKMAMNIRDFQKDDMSMNIYGADKNIQELIVLKEIVKLLEEGKI